MRVWRARGVEAAPDARGSVVVIDVLRAFTVAACAVARGARDVRLVGEVDEARRLRESHPAWLLVGEVQGRPIAGFDFGNSPEAIEAADLEGRTLVLRTSSGTQGVVRAERASAVYLGSLVTARATARALLERGDDVTLLAMGWAGSGHGDEDEACADLLEDLLADRAPDHARLAARVRDSEAGRNALDPAKPWITPGDLEIALCFDRFDFALRVERDEIGRRASRVP